MNEQDLKNFALEVFSSFDDYSTVDLGQEYLEDIAVNHGLLIPVTRRQPCSKDCACARICNDEDFARGVECYDKADYLFIEASDYTRPELTEEDKQAAENYARKTFRKYGIGQVVNMVASLCIENVRLVKEINEHRAARGIDPLPVFEV